MGGGDNQPAHGTTQSAIILELRSKRSIKQKKRFILDVG